MKAAEATGRAIAIMYDISGSSEDLWIDTIQRDWEHLQKDFGLTKSPSYLHQDSKPVRGIGDPSTLYCVKSTALMGCRRNGAPPSVSSRGSVASYLCRFMLTCAHSDHSS